MRLPGWGWVAVGFALGGCGARATVSRPPAAPPSPPAPYLGAKPEPIQYMLAFYAGPWNLRAVPEVVGEIAKSNGRTFQYGQESSVDRRLDQMSRGNLGRDPHGKSQSPQLLDVAGAGGCRAMVLTENGPWSGNESLQNLEAGLRRYAAEMRSMNPGATIWMEETWPCRDTGTAAGCTDDPFSVKSNLKWPDRVRRDIASWDALWLKARRSETARPLLLLLPTARCLLHLAERAGEGKVHGLRDYHDLFAGPCELSPAALYYVACIHYRFLFGATVKDIADGPAKIDGATLSARTAKDLRDVADEALPAPMPSKGQTMRMRVASQRFEHRPVR